MVVKGVYEVDKETIEFSGVSLTALLSDGK